MERVQRVNQLIKKELSQIVFREIDLPQGVLVTLTRVETSKNLIQSKAYVSVMPEEKSSHILEVLDRRIYDIQQQLNKRLKMRPMPKIIFYQEEKTKTAAEIEKIIQKIHKKNA